MWAWYDKNHGRKIFKTYVYGITKCFGNNCVNEDGRKYQVSEWAELNIPSSLSKVSEMKKQNQFSHQGLEGNILSQCPYRISGKEKKERISIIAQGSKSKNGTVLYKYEDKI